MKRYFIIAVVFLLSSASVASAQKLAVKTNALYWGTATPNLGLEVAFAERFTLDVEGGYNPWTFDAEKNMKIKHWLISPEVRYWFCESFQGHFIGVNANYTQFNIGSVPVPVSPLFIDITGNYVTDLENSRIQGWATGAGVTYGCAFPIARRWNMELTLGYGLWLSRYDQFENRKCGLFQQTVEKVSLGPTALGVSFIYMIR